MSWMSTQVLAVAFIVLTAGVNGNDCETDMCAGATNLLQSKLNQKGKSDLMSEDATGQHVDGVSGCKDYTKQFDEFEDKAPPFGASDVDGDRCDFYAKDSNQCGKFDDEDFLANEMCCSCGGGSTYPGARKLAVNEASVFLSQGSGCPSGFEPITTVATCRAALDLLGMSGMDYNGAESSSDWPKGCYYCKGMSGCEDGVWFNSHASGDTMDGTRRFCQKNFIAGDVEVLFVGDSDIDYWDSSVAFRGSVNIGVGGYTTNDVIKEVDQWVDEFDPTWVVLVCGENDIGGKRRATEKALTRFKTIANKFIDDGARVIYLGTKVEPDSKELYDEYMYYDAELRKFASEKSQGTEEPPFQMIDVFQSFTKTLKQGKPPSSWSQLYNSDGLHMSRLGYKLWNAWVKVAMLSTTACVRWSSGICAEKP